MPSSFESIRRKCRDCKHVFVLKPKLDDKEKEQSTVSYLQSKEYMINGKLYKLIWFDCPSCGCRHYCQVDDKRTMSLLKRVSEVLEIALENDGMLENNQRLHLRRLRGDLATSRKKLEKKLEGEHVEDPTTKLVYPLVFDVGEQDEQ